MIYPFADRLEKQVESRYTLVVLAAKRARQLREGAPKLITTTSTNPLTIALEEIAAGKVTFAVASHDNVPAYVPEAEAEGLLPVESAQEEAAEITAEAPVPQDEAKRVAELLQVPVEEETAEAPTEEMTKEPETEASSEEEQTASAEPADEPEEEESGSEATDEE